MAAGAIRRNARAPEKPVRDAAGHEVATVADGDAAWQLLRESGADLVVSDVEMSRMDGFPLTRRIALFESPRRPPVAPGARRESDVDEPCGAAPGASAVEISVSDSGVAREEAHLLFQPFSKLSARPTAGEQPTGLGLSIVREVTDWHGGKVWCESSPGHGATFRVELTLRLSRPPS